MKETDGNLVMALELACESQRVDKLTEGRKLVGEFIHKLGVETVEEHAHAHIDLSEEWEYRRLAEVYRSHDISALKRLIELGEISNNPEIVNAANEFKTYSSEPDGADIGGKRRV